MKNKSSNEELSGNYFKIINRKGRMNLREILPLEKPLSIFIEPTNICNFRCVACVQGSEETRNDLKPFCHMDIKLFKKIINDIKAMKGGKLKLLRLAILGEPFVHPQFAEMLKLAKESEVAEVVDTFSNGSLLTPKLSEQLVEYGLDYIRFSIYSVIDERHKKVTRSEIKVKDIWQNIVTLKKIREEKKSNKPYILVKMFDSYGEENEKFINMYKDIADEIGFEKVHDATKYTKNDLIKAYYGDEELEKITREEYKKNLNNLVACPRPFMSLSINNLGDVLMCTHDAPKATKIGNLQTEKLDDLWNGEKLFKFRKMQLSGNHSQNRLCKNCDWYKLFPEEDNVDGMDIEMFSPKKR